MWQKTRVILKGGKAMAKSKWDDVKDKLLLVEGWARDGLTDEQIAKNLGINVGTLYRYKNEHDEICKALKKGKEVVDMQVENALLKQALEGNTTAQIFWLKNRKPKMWRDKQELDANVNANIVIKVKKPGDL